MLGKLFDRQPASGGASATPGLSGPRIPRHSGGWSALRKRLTAEPGLRVLDVGTTSPANINYLTSLGHSVYMADLIEDASSEEWISGQDEDGKPVWDVEGFTRRRTFFLGERWTLCCYGRPWTTCLRHWKPAGGAVCTVWLRAGRKCYRSCFIPS